MLKFKSKPLLRLSFLSVLILVLCILYMIVRTERGTYTIAEAHFNTQFLYAPTLQKGLTNQKLQLVRLLRLAYSMNRTLILPSLNDFVPLSNSSVAIPCQEGLYCHTIPFSSVFDTTKFIQNIKDRVNVNCVDITQLPSNWRSAWNTEKVQIPKRLKRQQEKEFYLFQGLKKAEHAKVVVLQGLVGSLPTLRDKELSHSSASAKNMFEEALQSSFHLNAFLSRRLKGMSKENLYTNCHHEIKKTLAVHLRAEPDIRRICGMKCFTAEEMLLWTIRAFEGQRDDIFMIILTGDSLLFNTTKYLRDLGWCTSKVGELVNKSGLLHIQQSSIDYEVGISASFFVGLRISSFSTEIFKIRGRTSRNSWEFVKEGLQKIKPTKP